MFEAFLLDYFSTQLLSLFLPFRPSFFFKPFTFSKAFSNGPSFELALQNPLNSKHLNDHHFALVAEVWQKNMKVFPNYILDLIDFCQFLDKAMDDLEQMIFLHCNFLH